MSQILEKEPRLIQLPSQGMVVFVGDTHGDLDASQEIARRYLKPPYRIVFLGDYVDRGDDSEENIKYLLELKWKHPEEIFLLTGNHEGFMAKEFYPTNFWTSISLREKKEYGLLFSRFPFATTTQNGILSLHGVLPDIKSIKEMDRIELGDENWDRMVWRDFVENNTDSVGDLGGRNPMLL